MGDNSTKMFRQILAIFLNLSKKQDPNPVPEVQTLYHIFSNNPFSPPPTYKLNNLANGLIIMKNFLQKFYPNRESISEMIINTFTINSGYLKLYVKS